MVLTGFLLLSAGQYDRLSLTRRQFTEYLCLEVKEINQTFRIKLSLLTDLFAKISPIVVASFS
jgi:hypothetical protein